MATTTKLFTFDSSTEGFSFTSSAFSTGIRQTSDGNPTLGCLQAALASSSSNNTESNYWQWSGSWQDLGVPAGAVVTAVRLNSTRTRASTVNGPFGGSITFGPYELRDGSDVLQVTLWGGRGPATTNEASWSITGAQADQAVPGDLQAASSTIRLRLNNTLSKDYVGGTTTLREDNLELVITHSSGTVTTNLGHSVGGWLQQTDVARAATTSEVLRATTSKQATSDSQLTGATQRTHTITAGLNLPGVRSHGAGALPRRTATAGHGGGTYARYVPVQRQLASGYLKSGDLATTIQASFPFVAGQQGFFAAGGTNTQMGWSPIDGSPAGSLRTWISSGVTVPSETTYWEWSGTWESLGAPAGSLVTSLRLESALVKVTSLVPAGSSVTNGPYTVHNSAGDQQAVLWAGRRVGGLGADTTTADVDWVTVGQQGDWQVPPEMQASGTQLRLRLGHTINVGVVAENPQTVTPVDLSAGDDQITYSVTYQSAPVAAALAHTAGAAFRKGLGVSHVASGYALSGLTYRSHTAQPYVVWTGSTTGIVGTTVGIYWHTAGDACAGDGTVGEDLRLVWEVDADGAGCDDPCHDCGKFLVCAETQLKWGVGLTVGRDLSLLWHQLEAVGPATVLQWDTLVPVANTNVLRWSTWENVQLDAGLVWDTAAATHTIDLDVVWGVHEVVGANLDVVWDVHEVVGQDSDLVWDAYEVVGQDSDLAWDDLGLAGTDLDLFWETFETVGCELTAAWDTLTTLYATMQTVWDVRGMPGTALQFRFDTLQLAGRDAEIFWHQRGPVGTQLGLVWHVTRSVTAATSLSWVVRVETAYTERAAGLLAAAHQNLAGLRLRRGAAGGGHNAHRYLEHHGAAILEPLEFEPDPATYRGHYYYNSRENRLYQKVITSHRPEQGIVVAHWKGVSQFR